MQGIYGLLGSQIGHSLSPVLHRAARTGIEYRLFPMTPEGVPTFLHNMRESGIRGLSVTMPFKEMILPIGDISSDEVFRIGAANTVVVRDDGLIGLHNTDAYGAIMALREKIDPVDKRALVIGAGGAARAIIFGLVQVGTDVFVVNRDMVKATEVAKDLGARAVDWSDVNSHKFDIVVNATPVDPEIDLAGVQVVMDIRTHPLMTDFLRGAEEAGAEIISGERMLLHQAAKQSELFFGETPDVARMEEALSRELKKR